MDAGRHRSRHRKNRIVESKAPGATPSFWITKVLTTAMGEATSDFLVRVMDPYVAVALGAVFFAVAFTIQLSLRRYVIWAYWLAVVGVGVFGTMVADALHVGLGVPYKVSAPLFAIALAVVMVTWYATERTLSIHTIWTPRREMFYWAAVVVTFALGTAAGDMTASTLGLGYLASGFLFLAVIAVPAIGYGLLRMNAVCAFWFAYILTRPVGATFADWLGFPRSAGGLGIGHGPVSLVTTVLIVICVLVMSATSGARADRLARPGPPVLDRAPGRP